MFDWLRKLFIGSPPVETKPEIVEATKPVVVDVPSPEPVKKQPVKSKTPTPKTQPTTSKAMQNAKRTTRRKSSSNPMK